MSEAADTKRTYKDSLFRMIFQDRAALLSLYNAINGSHYEDLQGLKITTLEDVIYLGWKNDVSFLIQDVLNLYEHQSTWNPNMPLRGLFYISSLYQGYVKENDLDLYSSALLKLPVPRCIVFYNGTHQEPDQMELRLSDSFIKKEEDPCIECTVLILNINYGHNKELMAACRKLYEYSYFVHKVREFLEQGLTRDAAVDRAVVYCIKADILKDFLTRHRAEVKDVILTEYDEKRHERTLREEAKAQGMKEGIKKGIQEGEFKKAREMAAEMLRDGIAPEKVKAYAKLGDEQWDELLKSLGMADQV